MRFIIGILVVLLGVSTFAGTEEKPKKPISTKTIATLEGRVARVVSGDMFILVTKDHARRLIRLSFIDAPEWNQPFFKEAKDKLAELLKKGKVKVDYYKIDSSHRYIGRVYAGDIYVNYELVKAGLAWYCTKCGSDERIDKVYEIARKKKLGLWIDPHPISPMEMRTGQPCAVCSKK